MKIEDAYAARKTREYMTMTRAERMRIHGTILSEPWGMGSAILAQEIAEGLSALLLAAADAEEPRG